MEPGVEKALHDEMERLSPEQQRAVVRFARQLGGKALAGTPAAELSGLVGLIPREDLDEIERAIEEGCESEG
jgi:hypothetical protein